MIGDEETEESKWQTITVRLSPGRVWTKNTGSIIVLTHCSYAVPADSSSSYYAILNARTWTESITLCTLLPKDPSKKLKLIWGPTQTVYLMNRGNRELTMVLLMKKTCL